MLIQNICSSNDDDNDQTSLVETTPRSLLQTLTAKHSLSPNNCQVLVYAFTTYDDLLLVDQGTRDERPSAEATLPSTCFIAQGLQTDPELADQPLSATLKKILRPYHLDSGIYDAAVIVTEVGRDPLALHDPAQQQVIIHIACRIQPVKSVKSVSYWHGTSTDLVRYSCEHFSEEDRTLLSYYLDEWKKTSSTRTDLDTRPVPVPVKPSVWDIIWQAMIGLPHKLREKHKEHARRMDLWR